MLLIDKYTRQITIPDKDRVFGVESDEKTDVKIFRAPRYTGNGKDLMDFGIRINYINAAGEEDQYIVQDAHVIDEYIEFSWELSRKVTEYKGFVKFLVCAVKAVEEGTVQNEWNTAIAIGEVLKGMEVDGSGYEEQTSDAIEGILLKVSTRVNQITDEMNRRFEEVSEKLDETETYWKESKEYSEKSKDEAEKSKESAETAQRAAQSAFDDAVTSLNAKEDAKRYSEQAEKDAEEVKKAAGTAEGAAGAAQRAAGEAESAKTDAIRAAESAGRIVDGFDQTVGNAIKAIEKKAQEEINKIPDYTEELESIDERLADLESGSGVDSEARKDIADLKGELESTNQNLGSTTQSLEEAKGKFAKDIADLSKGLGDADRKIDSVESALKSDLDEIENKIKITSVYTNVTNGTIDNPGNTDYVHTDRIPVKYGDVVTIKTNRPLQNGYEYKIQISLYKSDGTFYSYVGFTIGLIPYVVINTPVAYIAYDIGQNNENSQTSIIRESDFKGYKVWVEIAEQGNIVDSMNAEDNIIPLMRNGSLGNSGNGNVIATLKNIPVNSTGIMQLEYLPDIPSVYTLNWDINLLDASGKVLKNFETTGKFVDISSDLQYYTESAFINFDIRMTDSNDTVIPLRIKDVGNCVKVQCFDSIYQWNYNRDLLPARDREVFSFIANNGKIIFKDQPIYRASNRCAWKIVNDIGFKKGLQSAKYIKAQTIMDACAANDSIVEDGETWIYLRANYGIVFNNNDDTVSLVDLSSTYKLGKDQYLLIGTWSGYFVAGLLLTKFMRDAYTPATTSFNSSNILYDIDVSENAAKFAELIGSSTDTEAFVFFTDPHTYGNNYNALEAEYLQTVVQKYFNSIPANFVLCGGDWLTNSDTLVAAKYKLGLATQSMNKMVRPYYGMIGNHDTNSQGVTKLTNGELINTMFTGYEHAYYSFETKNTKFFVFDSGDDGNQSMGAYQWEQIGWFASALTKETKAHIAIAIHIWIDSTNTRQMVNNLIDLITAYNNKIGIELNGISYDYTSATGRIEFVISGHTHGDTYQTIDNSVPVVITRNAMKNGVVCFDMIYVDYSQNKLHCIRVGNGSNRTFSLITGSPITD